MRISAAAKQNNLSYSRLMGALKKAGIGLDRKALSEIATRDPERFTSLVKMVSQPQA